jgi:type III restriction enzyme
VKPVQATEASHLNYVACDTNSWEQAAMFHLEKLAQQDGVLCYARNDHLEFNIPYEMYGYSHVYEPDFLVKLKTGVTVILEIKGQEHETTEAKHQAARRWMSAVNNWARLGEWEFLVCREPQLLAAGLRRLIGARRERLRLVADQLQMQAEQELSRLHGLGWTQTDFAGALQRLLEEEK